MKNLTLKLKRLGGFVLFVATTALMVIGCSMFEAPTATDTTDNIHGDLWNPESGYLIDGHEVPIVGDNYWENLYGPSINPRFFYVAPADEHIDGDVGGTVTLGNHRYIVPAGAVDGDYEFTMAYASMNGIAVDCGPSPLDFNIPVTLTLSYAGTQYDTNSDGLHDAANLSIYYMDADGNLTRMEHNTLNRGQKSISCQVTHFSRYILG